MSTILPTPTHRATPLKDHAAESLVQYPNFVIPEERFIGSIHRCGVLIASIPWFSTAPIACNRTLLLQDSSVLDATIVAQDALTKSATSGPRTRAKGWLGKGQQTLSHCERYCCVDVPEVVEPSRPLDAQCEANGKKQSRSTVHSCR